MKLMSASAFLKQVFCKESRVTKKWIEDSVKQGVLPGVRLGYETFIDMDSWARVEKNLLSVWKTSEFQEEKEVSSPKTSGNTNPLLAGVMKG